MKSISDDLSRAMKLNGMLIKLPIRQLIGAARPTHFINGVAIERLVTPEITEAKIIAFGIFFECEIDAWYWFEPNKDTQFQMVEK